MKKLTISLIALLSVVVFTACSSNDKEEAEGQNNTIEIADEEKLADEDVVVLVNGSEVLGNKYNIIYPQIKMYATQMEEDEVDLDVIKERTVDALIDQELIYQGAEKEGVVVTEEEVLEKFEQIKSENEEGLNSLLKQFHLTEQGFKDQLMFEETMEQFIDLMIDVEITDEDVEKYYEEIKEQNENIPALEDVKAQLEMQLMQEKTEEELEAIVVKMKEEAEIEKMI